MFKKHILVWVVIGKISLQATSPKYLNMASAFKDRNVIEIEDFSKQDLELIMDVAENIKKQPSIFSKSLEGKFVGLLFFEPSTRTYGSFSNATHRLGGQTEDIRDPDYSSAKKGETLTDTIKMFENWVDCIVLRHPNDGAARLASDLTDKPVINGGDGKNQHPTQSMLDIFTIREAFGHIDRLKIGLCGDLKYGRTVPSLSGALSNYDVEISFIAPEELQVRDEVLGKLDDKKIQYKKFKHPSDVIRELDVLYVTRIQKERLADPLIYESLKGSYCVDAKSLACAKPELKIMHPLPRVGELSFDVDSTQHQLYFEQAKNGLYVRMALLHLILGNSNS